jgi:hypothetical protein
MYKLIVCDRTRSWEKNKAFHRKDGFPAIEFKDGDFSYYSNGNKYFFFEQENGTKEYYRWDGKLSKENGPAVVYANGDVEYWLFGIRHRTDGPAVVYGDKQYWFEFGEFRKCIVQK